MVRSRWIPFVLATAAIIISTLSLLMQMDVIK